MKKFIKVLLILIIFVLLVFDFIGLWKYKLSGTTYELASSDDDGTELDDVGEPEDTTNYEELKSADIENGEKLFIKNIEKKDNEKYEVKGLLYKLCEISKDEYNTLRNGKSVTIMGVEYQKDKIKSNNLILKSSDENAKDCYVTYNTSSKKYIVKSTKTDYDIYVKTDKYVKIDVSEGTDFNTEKNGKTEKSKIEKVVDSHQNIEEHAENDEKINLSLITLDKKGNCTKIVESIR